MADEKKAEVSFSDESYEDVAGKLAEALGVEEGADGPNELEEFYAEAEKEIRKEHPEPEPAQATEQKEEKQVWVHEPTGREFESREDYLEYNSGWTADKLGNENKELRERLERLEKGESRGESQQQPIEPKQVMKEIWPNLDEDMYDDPAVKMMYQGLEKAAGLMQQQFDSKLNELKQGYEGLQSKLEAERVRAQFGVAPDVEQKLLEKHPGLKALPPQDRLAVMKDLVASNGQAERPSPKLADKVPSVKAEDHVEGSAISSAPDSDDNFDAAVEKKLFELDDDKRTSIFGQLFERSGTFDRFDR